jgi:hypothetical protein
LVHAVAMLATVVAAGSQEDEKIQRSWIRCCWAFAVGILLFSGSLYCPSHWVGPAGWDPLTPIGGLALDRRLDRGDHRSCPQGSGPDRLISPCNCPMTSGRCLIACAARKAGPRLVGGGVRDWLLGIASKDFDVEVGDMTLEELHRALLPFGSTDVVGRSFGVIKLRHNGLEYDFSLPRRESKTGAGHRGFAVEPDPSLSDHAAAARRDFTINAIAYDPFSGAVIDPYNGQADLSARILRHTSAAFVEDPLRVLRAMQLAARFDLSLAPETAQLCQSISAAFTELPVERIWAEWEKWAVKSIKPSRGITVLEATGWLNHFPEIAALRGCTQEPEWHPEGDVHPARSAQAAHRGGRRHRRL